MRIAQVVALLSADGSFGGPFSVAREQCAALGALGHDVTLFCGWDGIADLPVGPFEVVAERVRQLVPGSGVLGLYSSRLVRQLLRRLADFDVVHVHLGRDLLTMSIARLVCGRTPTFVQTHGMVMPSTRPRVRVMDALATRTVLTTARTAFCLTPTEQAGLADVAREPIRLTPLRNGLKDLHGGAEVEHSPPTVLFCARLQTRKRVGAFVEMAGLLAASRPELRFVVAGPDEGDLPAVEQAMASLPQLSYAGALSAGGAQDALRAADVYVLPSVDEPFPMTVLEALSLGTPVVMTDSCGIADELLALDAAAITDGSPLALANAVEELLASPALQGRRVEAGRRAVAERFSIAAVARDLVRAYTAAEVRRT